MLDIQEQDPNGLVRSGVLINTSHSRQYPIINYIPRFVDKEHYSSSFGYEWEKWPRVQFESENTNKPMARYTTKMFHASTGFTENDIQNKTVVEFGCGPGRFLDVVRSWDGIVVGIDMSLAVEVARTNFKDDTNALIVQGDVLNPPFKNNVFDHGYTIGVLHHTNNPGLGLKKLIEIVKPGGKVACRVYPKKSLYDYFSVWYFRKIHEVLGTILGRNIILKIYLAYSYFSSYVLYYIFNPIKRLKYVGKVISLIDRYFLVVVYLPDAKWRLLDTFDAITPYYASTHTEDEVRNWYNTAGIKNLEKTHGTTSFVGIK